MRYGLDGSFKHLPSPAIGLRVHGWEFDKQLSGYITGIILYLIIIEIKLSITKEF